RLTLDEARSIAAAAGLNDAAFVRSQHLLCDGWVAGFVLLLEHVKRVSERGLLPSEHTRNALFNYFSRDLFTAAPAGTEYLLLGPALLPSFTIDQAATFASREEARQVIGRIVQHNFFIDSRGGPEAIYRYHNLFREFLLERGRVALPRQRRLELLLQA